MKTKQLPLVNYGQAKRLKEAGFGWKTCQFYSVGGILSAAYDTPRNCNAEYTEISAPTVALAMQWMRGEKGIFCHVAPEVSYGDGWVGVFGFNARDVHTTHKSYPLYEAAESALLDAILDALMDILGKNNNNN